ncbi:hypothetical protein [Polaribacter sp. BM10]|uniref:hypothetical protein n=1 Tax=Polaribacter sp. BM10 TaxID=1529069 RepID=UPI0011EA5CD2|nr:hypothetical protein [Polaribacter sp. BM10]
MKSKLLPILLLLLVVLNGVLIFMLINKPHIKENERRGRDFLIEELNFTKDQEKEFLVLDTSHREKMRSLEEQVKNNKNKLFNSFGILEQEVELIAKEIGSLEGKKELEVFSFFNKVRDLCSQEQKDKLEKIVRKAIHGNNKMPPPRDGRMPPQNRGNRPPPR